MSLLGSANTWALHASTIIRPAAEVDTDERGYITAHPFFPDRAEWLYGGLAFFIVVGLLWKFAGPSIKDGLAKRTERIAKELDDAAAAKTAAAAEAEQIRTAKGDIAAERARILAEADEQAAAVLAEGEARLEQELADLEARSLAEIAATRNRTGDELRAEIARLSAAAVDQVVTGSLDDATHQDLIESFIARVGASR